MPAQPGKQKQAIKKKQREREKHRHVGPPSRPSVALIANQVAMLPHGPSYVSASFADTRSELPQLVMVLLTRRTPDGLLFPAVALVDRTCLGVKSGYLGPPLARPRLLAFIDRLGSVHPGGLVTCERLVAQSIVYHALDYAASLGFAPDPDFPEVLFGPRPEVLLDTPLARPERPYFVDGPDDDVNAILEQLDRAVGPGNYDMMVRAA